MLLKIETGTDNPILRKKSEPIRQITKKTLKLIKDMEQTMHEAKGVGLAAPQVGVNERLILITLNNGIVLAMINPEIVGAGKASEYGEEGCLSLPGYWGEVERLKAITVRFLSPKGQGVTMEFKGFEAREIQHEIDHLNGILFTDYIEQEDLVFDPNSLGEVRNLV